MKNIQKHISWMLAACVVSLFLGSCGRAGGNYQGSEYMPDMAHSLAYEANNYFYYHNNRWGGEENYRKFYEEKLQAKKPVKGTIARHQHPYHYQDSDAERSRAMAEVHNPIKPTTEEQLKDVLAKGKFLYETYCGKSCHGVKGDGNGKLWNNGSGPYPNKPVSYIADDFIAAGNSDGRFYHAIMYGKGVMQSHADKLTHDERWMVIHYIRSLQATAKSQKYDLAAATGVHTTVAPDTTTAVTPH